MRKIVSFVLALMALPAAAQAGPWYVRADAGYGWGRDAEIEDKDCGSANSAFGCGNIVTGDFGNGGVVDFGVGYQIKPWLRTDVTVAYRGGYSFDGSAGGTPVEEDLRAWTGMLSAYVDVRGLTDRKMGVFHPYVGAGIGASNNHLGRLTAKDGSYSTPGGTETDFAWSLTAGTGIMVINKTLMFDIAYRYVDLGQASGDAGLDSFGGPVDGTKTDIQMHEVTAGLRYLF
ncbi:MAG: outer membrane beta-barrel protein [Magnetospirillum sp.]|nr:outer membrane beta-barrel protein [Magnetospirillum sp.]